MNWWRNLKGKVRPAQLLKARTTFKVGGPADFFIEPRDPADLKALLGLRAKYKIPLSIIGSGSNIMAPDKGVKGAVVRLSSSYFRKISFKGNCLEAGSGALLNKVILSGKQKGLSGMEYLTGIPGTVGGALAMNAGIPKRCIGDLVRDVRVMDRSGKIKALPKRKIKFSYRSSGLDKYIILSARFNLEKAAKTEIQNRIKSQLKWRKDNQDMAQASAGCVFKNPSGYSAGKLIDLCGLKGKSVGGACVSLKHANFIINRGNARAQDVLKLMQLVRRQVKNKFGVTLEPEIKIWR